MTFSLISIELHVWYLKFWCHSKSKWGEEVLNALCVWKAMCQEFKNQPMRALDSNTVLWAWPRVQAITRFQLKMLAASSQYKTSLHEEPSRKTPSFFKILRKIKWSGCGHARLLVRGKNIAEKFAGLVLLLISRSYISTIWKSVYRVHLSLKNNKSRPRLVAALQQGWN